MSEQDVLRSYSARAGEYVAAFGRVERPSILALARGTLGGILARYSLIHMPPEGVGRALDQFREALVPGGSLFVGFFAGDAFGPFPHEVLRAYQWPVAAMAALLECRGIRRSGSSNTDRAGQPAARGDHREPGQVRRPASSRAKPGGVSVSVLNVSITLREVSEDNAQSVLALRCTVEQERFVSSVADSLAEATQYPQANPWARAVYAGDEPVGFVMLSWNVEPQPPEILGPWFLWKLLIDHRHQRKGYGREVVEQIVQLVGGQGATELLTSYVPGDGGPAGFYSRLGFVPTGELDASGEVILCRDIRAR